MPEVSTKDLLNAIADSFKDSNKEGRNEHSYLQKEDVDYVLDGSLFVCSEY